MNPIDAYFISQSHNPDAILYIASFHGLHYV